MWQVPQAVFRAGGMRMLEAVEAIPAVLGAIWVIIGCRVPAAYPGDPSVGVSLRWLRGDRLMWLLGALLFVGMGIFNAVATWLEAILQHFGLGGASGWLVAVMTVGGIIGGALLPEAVAVRDRRRGLLLTAVTVTAVAFLGIALLHNVVFLAIALFVDGFFLLAGLPVTLDWSELHAGPERAGEAAGFLLLAGNLGGFVLVLVVQAFVGSPVPALLSMTVIGVLGGLAAWQLPARANRPTTPADPA